MTLLVALSSGKALAAGNSVALGPFACDGVVQAGQDRIVLNGIYPVGTGRRCIAIESLGLQVRKPFTLFSASMDRYGRKTARVVDSQKENLAVRLVAEGMAVFMPGSGLSAREVANFLEAEKAARQESRGAWGKGFSILSTTRDVPVGKYVVVEGIVRRVGKSRDMAFLDFGEDYRKDFTIVVPKKLWKFFDGFSGISGQRVRVRGFVLSRYGPQIQVSHKESLEILTGQGPPKP